MRGQLTRLVHPGRRVIFDNPPRPMVLAAYADADLFVFCSMIECSPLVLFEAIAAGLPFVSVDVGNAAEIAAWSGAGVIVPSRRTAEGLVEAETGDVAAAIDELLADARTRRSLATRGRRAWAEHFTWEAATTRYEQLYGRVVRSEA